MYVGEFEHLLLLTILRLGREAFGVEINRELEARADRRVSRGALYTSLDRLETKGLVKWKVAPGTAARDGMPRRLYTVTASGMASLRETRQLLRRMWHGLEHLLNEPAP